MRRLMWSFTETARICSGEKVGDANIAMIIAFSLYIARSKTFRKYDDMHGEVDKIFTVESAVEDMIEKKQLGRDNLMFIENITRCFESIRMINIVYARLETMRKESFDIFNEHHMAMLNSFWMNMKGKPRKKKGFISDEWLELGFQGSDPSTDFRGMGGLGLFQLLYFSQHKSQSAHMILEELGNPKLFYPFSIVGINVTKFIMELLVERRLDRIIIENFGNMTINSSLAYLEGPSNDLDCINFCCDIVHDCYCMAFEEFYLIWVVRKPTNIMSFTELFDEMKDAFREKFPPLR